MVKQTTNISNFIAMIQCISFAEQQTLGNDLYLGSVMIAAWSGGNGGKLKTKQWPIHVSENEMVALPLIAYI
jgi:hypothetical protein